jgi:hypothetical protein
MPLSNALEFGADERRIMRNCAIAPLQLAWPILALNKPANGDNATAT